MAVATISLKTTHSKRETQPILVEALNAQRDFAYSRFMKFAQECEQFEQEYKMDSQQFLQQFESGELGDDEQWFDWYAVVRGKTLWNKKGILHARWGLANPHRHSRWIWQSNGSR